MPIITVPAAIAEATDHDPTERPCNETETVGKKAREQRRHIIGLWEKVLGDNAGNKGIDCEVVPLEHITDDRGGHRLPGI
jgi:hypothetical protein